MNALVLNSGSSSVKFALLGIAAGASENSPPLVIANGSVKGIGGQATLESTTERGGHVVLERSVADHPEALEWTFQFLSSLTTASGSSSLLKTVEVVGHRIVHGGDRFQAAVRIDDAVMKTMESLSELAPLHNPAGLAGIRAARAALGPGIPNIAVFDTAFHQTMPARASTYAIPLDLADRHRIRRYGFHGIAHASLLAGYAAFTGKAVEEVSVVIFHLGNGCSAAAVRYGRSIDTSMGFTPLEGLVMGTRSGDIDPSVVSYLVRHEGVEAEVVEQWLNERSGLLGISGRSRDMSALLAAAEEDDDQRAALAIDVFCYRARKYLGGYLAALGGADAVIFGGGIGENVPRVRAGICDNMQWCGLSIDKERNAQAVGLKPGAAARISPDDAALPAYVIPADEESWIARELARYLLTENA
ncbi:MAG TPA: acetate kinase [Nitrospirales bacterium]